MKLTRNKNGQIGDALVSFPSLFFVFVIITLFFILAGLLSKEQMKNVVLCDTSLLLKENSFSKEIYETPLANFLESEVYLDRPLRISQALACYCKSSIAELKYINPVSTQLIDSWNSFSEAGRYQLTLAYKLPEPFFGKADYVVFSSTETLNGDFNKDKGGKIVEAKDFPTSTLTYPVCTYSYNSGQGSKADDSGKDKVTLMLYIRDTQSGKIEVSS